MRRVLLLLFGSLTACGPKPAAEPSAPASTLPVVPATLAFEDVRVFDGEGWLDDVTVLVDGDRIVAVGPELPVSDEAQRVSGQGATLLPGLIDAHTHVQMPEQLTQALMFGVTTEIGMFSLPEMGQALRAQQAEGKASGRADLRAGILVTAPGGHGTEYGVKIPTLAGPDDAVAFVDEQLAEGSDFIKIVYDDGAGLGLERPTLELATLTAVIEAAHARDVLAVVYVGSQQGAIEALNAGADGLAHLFTDQAPSDAFVTAATERGAFVAETLGVIFSGCDGIRGAVLARDPRIEPFVGPASRRMLGKTTGDLPELGCQHALDATRALHEAGVPLLASTDALNPGVIHGASLHDELELLVKAGLSPRAALRAATAEPADAFGLDDRGRIAAGKRADLVLVKGDPGTDIQATRDILGVWKGGVAADRDAARERVATAWEQVRQAMDAPAPAGLDAGLVADFEGGELRSEFGAGWQGSTDAMMGGGSTVELSVVEGAMKVAGTIDPQMLPIAWSGVTFFPGEQPMTPANLSSKPSLVFRARGDGPMNVLVFAEQLGMVPAQITVEIGEEWAEHWVNLRALVAEPYDVSGIFFGGPSRAGAFTVEIDDVRLR
ncbi:MAG: amidohydrolase family protein [Myxococcota bacterium]